MGEAKRMGKTNRAGDTLSRDLKEAGRQRRLALSRCKGCTLCELRNKNVEKGMTPFGVAAPKLCIGKL